MTNPIHYSRWHTPRVVAANALDVIADITGTVSFVGAAWFGALALSAAFGDSPTYDPADAPALALLGLASLGIERVAFLLLSWPAARLRPGLGELPGWAVPASVREQVHGFLSAGGPVRVSEVARGLGLPRSTTRSALHRLAADGLAYRSRFGEWSETPGSHRQVDDSPQAPVIEGGEGETR
ncbi:helix-turn-helix domain-containing protein [Streptomyces sp. A73]|uniref:helix-turn-helix domain-containing protein n=1 Tax=Streptomyces smyrnaeus TaxID=1387713 RepID=UPI001B683C71|nr:helix-turn-helix domain-containing protein [Streptomyces sp. A73]